MRTKIKKGYSKITKAQLIESILKYGFENYDPSKNHTNQQALTAMTKNELINIYESQRKESKRTKAKPKAKPRPKAKQDIIERILKHKIYQHGGTRDDLINILKSRLTNYLDTQGKDPQLKKCINPLIIDIVDIIDEINEAYLKKHNKDDDDDDDDNNNNKDDNDNDKDDIDNKDDNNNKDDDDDDDNNNNNNKDDNDNDNDDNDDNDNDDNNDDNDNNNNNNDDNDNDDNDNDNNDDDDDDIDNNEYDKKAEARRQALLKREQEELERRLFKGLCEWRYDEGKSEIAILKNLYLCKFEETKREIYTALLSIEKHKNKDDDIFKNCPCSMHRKRTEAKKQALQAHTKLMVGYLNNSLQNIKLTI